MPLYAKGRRQKSITAKGGGVKNRENYAHVLNGWLRIFFSIHL